MNTKRRFGVLTAIAGAALALGSLTFGGSANATGSSNYHDYDGNVTVCPSGYTQYDGQITTGSGSTALFHWAVTSNKYVSITAIDPSVTTMKAYLKGGPHFRVYSPVISGQMMRSPDNGGDNIPALSHWMLCYKVTPPTTTTELATTTTELVTTTTELVTTTTELVTTTTELVTTTTEPEIVTTTTELVTTTTIGESGGPTTTAEATTTTELADEGGDLPTTGGGTSLQLALGLAMLGGGVLFTLLGRPTRDS